MLHKTKGIVLRHFKYTDSSVIADIYTQDTFNLPRNSFNRIVDIVIQSIINQLKNTIEMEQCNNKLDIWTGTLYGDFNKAGLRRHPKIKLRERHPHYMAFNMNY